MQVDFYHLNKRTIDVIFPKIMEKVFASGSRAVVKASSKLRVDYLNSLLWTYSNNSWLPHASEKDALSPENQPIWLTFVDENPNNAKIIVLLDGECIDFASSEYDRALIIFDGKDAESLQSARNAWKMAKEAEATLSYWQESENGSFKLKEL